MKSQTVSFSVRQEAIPLHSDHFSASCLLRFLKAIPEGVDNIFVIKNMTNMLWTSIGRNRYLRCYLLFLFTSSFWGLPTLPLLLLDLRWLQCGRLSWLLEPNSIPALWLKAASLLIDLYFIFFSWYLLALSWKVPVIVWISCSTFSLLLTSLLLVSWRGTDGLASAWQPSVGLFHQFAI